MFSPTQRNIALVSLVSLTVVLIYLVSSTAKPSSSRQLPAASITTMKPSTALEITQHTVTTVAANVTLQARNTARTIRFLRGWTNYGGKGSLNLTCKKSYTCVASYETGNDPGDADIVIFHAWRMPQVPSKKRQSQLWVIRTSESQQHLSEKTVITDWDGYFNYSVTFVRNANMTDLYSWSHRRLVKQLTRNFAKEKQVMSPQSFGWPSALWFVSNCGEAVMSGRMAYVRELSKLMSIRAYTQTEDCSAILHQNLAAGSAVVLKGHEPALKEFPFYLSFEKGICRDYITEKLWKVLHSDSLTIPVALGGMNMSEYEYFSPPNSYIHVKNFSSPEALAKHLKFVATDEKAFNYYHKWRNEYELYKKDRPGVLCLYCIWAHEKPHSVWKISDHFNRADCEDLSSAERHCSYYNLPCKK